MSELPTELKYASSHEWARLESDFSTQPKLTRLFNAYSPPEHRQPRPVWEKFPKIITTM